MLLHTLQNAALVLQVFAIAFLALRVTRGQKISEYVILIYAAVMFVLVYWIATLSM